MKLLIAKQFIIPFDSGIVVIKHWKIHNYIQSDRFKETICTEERKQLGYAENREYVKLDTECIQDVSTLETQYSIGKNSIDKSNSTHTFVPPTVDEVKAYCDERNNKVDPDRFVDFYSSKGWMIGKNKMKDWKAAVRTWEKDNKKTDWEKELEDWANE